VCLPGLGLGPQAPRHGLLQGGEGAEGAETTIDTQPRNPQLQDGLSELP